MNKFRQIFVSPRIKSHTFISTSNGNDQNSSNFETKRQSIAPSKYKCLSSSKSFQVQPNQKLKNQPNLSKQHGNLNQFCEKHVISLKKQFPTYFQSILNQLKKDGSVQLQKIEANLLKDEQVELTSFNNDCKNKVLKHQLVKQLPLPLSEIKNRQIVSQINSIYQKTIQKQSDKTQNFFNPYEESNVVSKSSFQQIHQREKQFKDQQNSYYSQTHNPLSNEFNHSTFDNLQKLDNKTNFYNSSEAKCEQKVKCEQTVIIQQQIQSICQKHISRLNRIIEQVSNIKNQLLNDVKQVVKRSRSKSIQLKSQIKANCIGFNKQQNKLNKIQKIKFPKVPKILTLQLLRKQLNQNDKQIQNQFKQSQNVLSQNQYVSSSQLKRQRKKRRSSPLKKIKFKQQLHKQQQHKQLQSQYKQTIFFKNIQYNKTKQQKISLQLNTSNQISFKFSSEQTNKKSVQPNSPNFIFPQLVSSFNSENVSQIQPKKSRKGFHQHHRSDKHEYQSSGSKILILDPQNDIYFSESQNPQRIDQKSKYFNNNNSIYLHRGNSIVQGFQSSKNSFTARLMSKQQKIQYQKFQLHRNSQYYDQIIKNSAYQNEGSFQKTKIDFQYSQSQFQVISKVDEQPQVINRKINSVPKEDYISKESKYINFKNMKVQKETENQKILDQVRHYLRTQLQDNNQFLKDAKIAEQFQNQEDSMLLSSYGQYYKENKNNSQISKESKENDQILKLKKSNQTQLNNKNKQNKDDIFYLKQCHQNSEICTQYIEKEETKSKSFFSQVYKQYQNIFSQQVPNSSFTQVTDQSFFLVSQTNLSVTPPNIKTIKQRVLQYKKIKQQRTKNEREQKQDKKLQFNKNIKLKFRKVQQKNCNSKKCKENRKALQCQKIQFKQQQKWTNQSNEKNQYNEQNLILQRKNKQGQNIIDEEQIKQVQQQIKNKECIYYQNRKKEVYKYPWLKFK